MLDLDADLVSRGIIVGQAPGIGDGEPPMISHLFSFRAHCETISLSWPLRVGLGLPRKILWVLDVRSAVERLTEG